MESACLCVEWAARTSLVFAGGAVEGSRKGGPERLSSGLA